MRVRRRTLARPQAAAFGSATAGERAEPHERDRNDEGGQPHEREQRARAAESAALLNLARAAARQGQTGQARQALLDALDALGDLPLPLQRADIEFQLGGSLAQAGDLAEALACWDAAAARLAAMEGGGDVLLSARLSMNRGIALADIGRFAEGRQALGKALALFEGLALAGRPGMQAERARALRNLGFVFGRAGRHSEAVAALEAALAVATPGPAAATAPEREARRATRGGALNSLGYSLFMLARFDEAHAALRRSVADLARGAANPARLDELARARINRAHLEAHGGRLATARRLYAAARDHFAARLARDAALAATDRLNADLGLARVALAQARADDAAALFVPAMADLAALTHQGQLQHERTWLAAWLAQRDAWLARPPPRGRQRARSHDALAARLLADALAAPPRHAAGLGPEPLHSLAEAAAAQASSLLPPPAAAPTPRYGCEEGERADEAAQEQVATAYLRFLLAWMRGLLTDTDPQWVRAQGAAIDTAIEALRANAAQRRDAGRMLAQWFLATRGLRALRAALVDAKDPGLAALHAALQQLHRIEQEILGEQQAATSGSSPDLQHAAAYCVAAVATASTGAAANAHPTVRLRRWQQLGAQVREAHCALAGAGLLPERLDLEADELAAALAPGQALILLARPAADRLLVIALHRALDARVSRLAPARIEHREQRLDPELASFSCHALHALARASWSGAQRFGACGAPSSPSALSALSVDRFALEMFARLWQQGLRATLERLVALGTRSIDLVPSGDLHLVPWNHLGDHHLRLPLRIFPSVGAWWRCLRDRAAAPPSAAMRWGVAAAGAGKPPVPPGQHGPSPGLPWAAAEMRLSQRLWGAAMQPLRFGTDQRIVAAECDAFLGMGHGQMAEANPARVGLVTGPAVLVPHDLLALQGCRRALLSACLLGHTDGRRGEALGFLSGCFDHRFVFAAGWLTEVPDQAACLFSLAAQWTLKANVVAAGSESAAGSDDWSQRLAGLRLTLLQGQWPAGFRNWLARQWHAGDPPGACPEHPPPALIRALPWAVALG